MADPDPLLFPTADVWESWLEENHASSTGVWLRHAKKASSLSSVTYAEALDAALCFGWIDGQKKTWDDDSFIQRFTPRRHRSIWSQRNRDKVQALIDAGRMRPAGLAEIERARADGRWDAAYAPSSETTVPEDLQAAIDANPSAAAFFATINRTKRFAIIFHTNGAKKPETRARRIAQYVEMLARGEVTYPTRSQGEG